MPVLGIWKTETWIVIMKMELEKGTGECIIITWDNDCMMWIKCIAEIAEIKRS